MQMQQRMMTIFLTMIFSTDKNMTAKDKKPLWDAINQYVKACGGDPSSKTCYGNLLRQQAVVDIEKIVQQFTNITGDR